MADPCILDSPTLDLGITGAGELTGAVKIDPVGCNAILTTAAGLLVHEHPVIATIAVAPDLNETYDPVTKTFSGPDPTKGGDVTFNFTNPSECAPAKLIAIAFPNNDQVSYAQGARRSSAMRLRLLFGGSTAEAVLARLDNGTGDIGLVQPAGLTPIAGVIDVAASGSVAVRAYKEMIDVVDPANPPNAYPHPSVDVGRCRILIIGLINS